MFDKTNLDFDEAKNCQIQSRLIQLSWSSSTSLLEDIVAIGACLCIAKHYLLAYGYPVICELS